MSGGRARQAPPLEDVWRRRDGGRGGGCGADGGGLVPAAAAGSGGVGVGVLEVDPPVSRSVRRVLGVGFWHLFCCKDTNSLA